MIENTIFELLGTLPCDSSIPACVDGRVHQYIGLVSFSRRVTRVGRCVLFTSGGQALHFMYPRGKRSGDDAREVCTHSLSWAGALPWRGGVLGRDAAIACLAVRKRCCEELTRFGEIGAKRPLLFLTAGVSRLAGSRRVMLLLEVPVG